MPFSCLKLCVLFIYLQTWTVNGQFFIVHGQYPYERAVEECAGRDAKLAVIRNKREQELVYNLTEVRLKIRGLHKNNGYCMAYIGLTRKGPGGTFKWIDGTKPNYKNWDKDEPKNGKRNDKHCAVLNQYYLNKWSTIKCTKERSALCKLSEKTKYFKTKSRRVYNSYKLADIACRRTESKLAIIRNEKEYQLAVKASKESSHFECKNENGYCKVLIGLTSSRPGNNFTWIDGTMPKATYWASGQPVSDDTRKCVMMKSRKWYNVVCDNIFITPLCELSTKSALSSLNASLEMPPRPAVKESDLVTISCGPTKYHTEPQTIVLTFGEFRERPEWRYEDARLKLSNKDGASNETLPVVNDLFSEDVTNSSLNRYYSVGLETKYWVPNRLNVSFRARPVHAGPVSCVVASTRNKKISDKGSANLKVTWPYKIYNITVESKKVKKDASRMILTVRCCYDPGSANKICEIIGADVWNNTVGPKEWVNGYPKICISWTVNMIKEEVCAIVCQVGDIKKPVPLPVPHPVPLPECEPGSSVAVPVVIVVLILAFLVVTAIVVVVVIIAVRRRRGRKSDGGPSAAPLHNGDSPDAAGDGATKPMIPMQTTATPALA